MLTKQYQGGLYPVSSVDRMMLTKQYQGVLYPVYSVDRMMLTKQYQGGLYPILNQKCHRLSQLACIQYPISACIEM